MEALELPGVSADGLECAILGVEALELQIPVVNVGVANLWGGRLGSANLRHGGVGVDGRFGAAIIWSDEMSFFSARRDGSVDGRCGRVARGSRIKLPCSQAAQWHRTPALRASPRARLMGHPKAAPACQAAQVNISCGEVSGQGVSGDSG